MRAAESRERLDKFTKVYDKLAADLDSIVRDHEKLLALLAADPHLKTTFTFDASKHISVKRKQARCHEANQKRLKKAQQQKQRRK